MRCEQAEEWMQRDLDGDLQPEQKQALQRHLATCDTCARQQAEWESLQKRLASLPPVSPPVSLVDRLQEEWSQEVVPSRSRASWIRRTSWGMGGLAAALLLVWWWGAGVDAPSTSSTNGPVQQEQNGEAPSPSQDQGGFGILSDEQEETQGPTLPSPDGSWVASQDGEQIRITDAEGNEVYQSKSWEDGAQVRLNWEEDDILHLQLQWRERTEQRWIDVSERRESDRPLSAQKERD